MSLVAHGVGTAALSRARRLRAWVGYRIPVQAAERTRVAEQAGDKRLYVLIAATFSLRQAQAAHELGPRSREPQKIVLSP